MKTNWLDLGLYPKVRLHILQHFVRNPELKNNQSQIAKSIETTQVSVSRNIGDLVTLRILKEERNGLSAIYSLNQDSIYVKKLFIPMIHSTQNLIPDFVKQILKSISKTAQKQVNQIILFGSAARGELQPNSDIDLLVLVDQSNTPLETALHEGLVDEGLKAGLKINLFVESSKTFEKNRSLPYLQSAKKEGIMIWRKGQT